MAQTWRINLLGGLTATREERILRFQTRTTGTILAYLAYHIGQELDRDEMVDRLWPEIDWDSARHSFCQALHSLRRSLDLEKRNDILISTRSHVWLNPEAVNTDVQEFTSLIKAAERSVYGSEHVRHLNQAVEVYSGNLLTGWMEDWIEPERLRLAATYVNALKRLLAELEQRGERGQAIECTLRAVSAIPECEEAHNELIRLQL